jgi:hypothetical protein
VVTKVTLVTVFWATTPQDEVGQTHHRRGGGGQPV